MPANNDNIKDALFAALLTTDPAKVGTKTHDELAFADRQGDIGSLSNAELIDYWLDDDTAANVATAFRQRPSPTWTAMQKRIDARRTPWGFAKAASAPGQVEVFNVFEGFKLVFEKWPQGWFMLSAIDQRPPTDEGENYRIDVMIGDEVVLRDRIVRKPGRNTGEANEKIPERFNYKDFETDNIRIFISGWPLKPAR